MKIIYYLCNIYVETLYGDEYYKTYIKVSSKHVI